MWWRGGSYKTRLVCGHLRLIFAGVSLRLWLSMNVFHILYFHKQKVLLNTKSHRPRGQRKLSCPRLGIICIRWKYYNGPVSYMLCILWYQTSFVFLSIFSLLTLPCFFNCSAPTLPRFSSSKFYTSGDKLPSFWKIPNIIVDSPYFAVKESRQRKGLWCPHS